MANRKQTIKKSTLKLPPQNLEAEESVLGAILIEKSAISEVADLLAPEDFYKPANEKIYQSMIELFEKGQPIDIVSLANRLKENGDLKEVGGSSYLAELVSHVPSAAHIAHYAKIVKEKRVLRDLIRASSDIAEKAFETGEDIEKILDNVEQKILNISQKSLPHNLISLKDELKEFYERLEKLENTQGLRGIPTGFTELDRMLSGLQKSNFIVLGARPSFGKTSLVLDIARQAALSSGLPIGIFSLEMNREQIIDRLVSAASQIPLWKIRTGQIKNEMDYAMIQEALSALSNTKIFIDDTPSPTVLQIRSMARRLQAEHGLGLLIIDYLQLIQSKSQFENTVAQFTEISHNLKALARELDIPVLVVSQLNRLVDQREGKVPRLSDLRESGAIEQDADIVMFLHKKDFNFENPSPDQNIAEILIAKHRNGPIGNIQLVFNHELASFKNKDKVHQDDQFA